MKTTTKLDRDLNMVSIFYFEFMAFVKTKPSSLVVKRFIKDFQKTEEMERIKVAPNFYLDEFVDPHTYFNTDDHGLSLIDDRLFDIAQHLRYLYGASISINNWWPYYMEQKETIPITTIIVRIEANKNLNKWSGLRTNRTKIGAKTSAHRTYKSLKCRAIDPKGLEYTLYKIVEGHADSFYKLGLRRLEDITITHGWLHMDTWERNTQPNSIRVVNKTEATKIINI